MLKLQLALVIFLSGLLLAACQAPAPGLSNSPLSAPVGRGPAITCTIESAQNYPDLKIGSIRLTADYVLALTQNGFYRATLNERRWSYLNCPGSLPTQGAFANHVHPTDPILFITQQGLFSTSNNGSTWHLVSNAYSFDNAFVHPDGTLYAIANITFSCAEPVHDAKSALDFLGGKSWDRICLGSIIVMSYDFGQSWQNITGNIAGGVSLSGIFQDPDHPDLVALSGSSIRGYILQATDKSYSWQMYSTLNWQKSHSASSKGFFIRDYWTQTTFYELSATLANYFDYNFREQAYLPGFDLSTDQTAYIFAPVGSKIITATIKFLPATDSTQLIDLKDSTDLWGIRILDSADHSIDQLPRLTQSSNKSADRQELMQQYRGRPDFYRFTINYTQTYTKSIDLDTLFNFSTPGIYQVQFTYANTAIADRNQGEWVGSFAGNVFTVTITAP